MLRRLRLSKASAFAAGHLLAVVAAASYVASAARLGRRVLILHLLLVFLGGIIAVAPFARARTSASPSAVSRAAFAVCAALMATLLTLLYIGTLVGHRWWGSGVNYQIVAQYAGLLAPERPPFFIPAWVHAVLAGASIATIAGYWRASRFVLPAAHRVLTSLPRSLAAAFAAIFVLALTASAWSVRSAGLTTREPIAGFFMTSDGVFDANQFTLDRELPAIAARARAEYPRNQSFARRNVVLIVVDALRADHMSVYGYERKTTPFLEELREAGRLYQVKLALSSCAESNCGILSTLTSKPFRHLSPHNFSLGQLLQDQGYNVYQLLSGNHDWNGLREAYGKEQTLYFDSAQSKRYPVNDDRVVFEGLERVPQFSGTPAFFQFHLMSVHFAGIKRDEYRKYQPSVVRQDFASIFNSPQDLEALANNYDNGVLQADATIRDLFAALDQKGYLANSLVVILADHGEGLGDRDAGPEGLGHVHSLHQEFIHIPLLFYDTEEAPYANLRFATQVDVAPTIVDRLGLKVPPTWEGRSLLDPSPRRYSFLQTSRWDPCYGIVERSAAGTYKLLRCDAGRDEELYDLDRDPEERRNLATDADPALAGSLRSALEAHLLGRAQN